MYSTTLDMYKWDRALRSESILPQAALKEMWTPIKNRYGYGWATMRSGEGANKRLEMSHDGGLAGFSSSITRFPEDDAVVIVLSNVDGAQAAAAGNALKAILYGEPFLPPTKVVGSAAALDRFVGDYEVEKQGIIRFSHTGEKLSLQTHGRSRSANFSSRCCVGFQDHL